METLFDRDFIEDLEFWVSTDRKIALKILKMVTEISREPFVGTGKPEPLKHLGGGVWSRRITHTDRLVYQVEKTRVYFLQCRYHY